jgi:hypothetical protein
MFSWGKFDNKNSTSSMLSIPLIVFVYILERILHLRLLLLVLQCLVDLLLSRMTLDFWLPFVACNLCMVMLELGKPFQSFQLLVNPQQFHIFCIIGQNSFHSCISTLSNGWFKFGRLWVKITKLINPKIDCMI